MTNNNLQQETFTSGGGGGLTPGGGFTTQEDTTITRVVAFFSSDIKHNTTNKKVELSPEGFQTVFLESDPVESVGNSYFRLAPQDDKPLDVLGRMTVTGSIDIRPQSGSGFLNVSTGSVTHPTIRFSRGTEGATFGFASVTSTTLGVVRQGTEHFRFSMADNKFHSNGDVVGFSDTISDKRFKKNIVPIDNSLDKILELRGVEFDWKDAYKERGHDLGFIAQEVEQVDGLQPIVSETWNIRTNEENVKVVSYERVVPVLVEAIKEQQKQIDELKKKLEDL